MVVRDPHLGLDHGKRKRRRRRQDKPAISARLVLDDHVNGDAGLISEDLFNDLFPGVAAFAAAATASGEDSTNISSGVQHIAIAPWTPSNIVEDLTWTLVPVIPSSALAHSTVQFSPSSLSLQSFADILQRLSPSKLLSHSRSGIEIRLLDAIPLTLDTVFVTIEAELARRLENGEGTFHNQHPKTMSHAVNGLSSRIQEDRLSSGIREALGALKVVHTGDFFGLPLPPHPITHVPPPPAKVTLCEPVAQGILSPQSKIIVTQAHHSKTTQKAQPLSLSKTLKQVAEEDEDTANDQFFSAAEDRYKTDAAVEDETEDTQTGTETEASGAENDDLSDDSMEDMISLQAPILPASTKSGFSTIQPGTPQTIGRGRTTNGISTPGSVFSSFTATTAKAGGQRGRLFKTHGLLQILPQEILHPKPAPEDDDEQRIFVDTNSLAKIGCFSGDWVRLETAEEPPAAGAGLWGLGSFGNNADEDVTWRPVKVFGLPEGYSQRPVTKIANSKQHEGRRLSFFESQVQKPTHPAAYLSPILLANMENTPYCRLSPLKRASVPGRASIPKITSFSMPPCARELTLTKVATPFSTDKELQNAIFAGLKSHLSSRTRIVRTGDLLAVQVDESLGRTMYQPISSSDDATVEDLLSLTEVNRQDLKGPKSVSVAWFRISNVVALEPGGDAEEDGDVWGGVASVDASSTRIAQQGTEKMRLPATMENPWEYYLGVKNIPKARFETLSAALPEQPRPQVTPLHRRLRELIAAATSPRAIHLQLPPLAILLVSTQRNIGKVTIATKACSDLGIHAFVTDAYDILSESGGATNGGGGNDVKSEAVLRARADRALLCGAPHCALVLRHVEALTAERMATALREALADLRVLVATTAEVDRVPDAVRAIFTHELEMAAPDEGERTGILRSIVDGGKGGVASSLAADADLGAVAVKTAALVAGDLVDVVDRALVARDTRLQLLAERASTAAGTTMAPTAPPTVTVRDVVVAGGSAVRGLTGGDFAQAVEAARRNFADAIGAPKIPSVTWDDVGGLAHVKAAVMETIQLPLERPELFARGMKKRSGILFYGPPGTGKTLLAKAIATEFSLNFFSVKGPELLNMYIGESEANVRRVFQRARDARPCVVFFDELDSVAPKRGNQGDSGGVMDRIVSQLLAELDGMSEGGSGDGDDEGNGGGSGGGNGVFVIGATNRPDLLDAALLRPGRFDKMLYLGVSDTHEKQLTIMEALTRKFTLHPSLSLKDVASYLPFTYTGADFYALCSDAMLKAVTRAASRVDEKVRAINAERQSREDDNSGGKGGVASSRRITTAQYFDHHASAEDLAVVVGEQDFADAQRELVPSVSHKELEHYARVREMFEGKKEGEESNEGLVVVQQRNGTIAGKGKAAMEAERERARPRLFPNRSGGSGKGKGKMTAAAVGKGKGKASAVDDDDDDDDDRDEDDNNRDDSTRLMHNSLSGSTGSLDKARSWTKGKGKGKAVDMGFVEGDEDEDIY